MSNGRVRIERDNESGIARVSPDSPERRNAYGLPCATSSAPI
jgi:hypothetical protein